MDRSLLININAAYLEKWENLCLIMTNKVNQKPLSEIIVVWAFY